jgi:hypothetical protein
MAINELLALMAKYNATLTVKPVRSVDTQVWRAQLDWQAYGLVVKIGDTAAEAVDMLNSWAAKQ